MKRNNSFWVTLSLIILLICMYLFIEPLNFTINQMILYLSNLNLDALKEYILSFGIWAPAISFLLMVLQSIVAPLPAFVITFTNAALFGWINGAILSWTSSMAGATLCFFIARFLGRDSVEKLTNKFAIDKVDSFFSSYGKYAILIARLLPFMSFDLVSYVAGLTSTKFLSFFIATGLGQLPATIVYSYVGEVLIGKAKYIMMGITTLFAITILIYVIKKAKKENV